MLLKVSATEKELRDAAALEAWSTHQMLVKGKLTIEQRRLFMTALAAAATAIITPPKRTRKPKKPDAS